MTHRIRRDDSGAALVLVLIVVTVIALGVSVLLSFVDTSIRTTVKMREQAAATYAADGAAQAAINKLRSAPDVADACHAASGAAQGLPADFYPQAGDGPGTAAWKCTYDPSNVDGGGANSSPGNAILTLGTGQGGEDGIYVDSSNNATIKVRGGIFSNSTINLNGNKSDLENTANTYTFAKGACYGSGQLLPAGLAVCNYASQPQSAYDRRGMDPSTVPGHGTSFDAPPAPSTNGSVAPPNCSAGKAVYEFQPGLYTSAAFLNGFTHSAGPCQDSVWVFNPGTYYFNFTDAGVRKWTVSSGYLVGGTLRAGLTRTVNAAKNWSAPYCVVPGTGAATGNSGVKFVFGGDSRMDITKSGTSNPNVQICASNSASGPPIAIHGLKTGIGSGAFAVPAQSACITATPYPMGSAGDAAHCPLIQTYQDPNPAFTIYGTSYAPRAVFDLNLNNNTVQVFRWGLVARSVAVRATGSAGSLLDPVINVPNDAPNPWPLPSLIHIDIYLCPPSGTCTMRLRVKVRITDGASRSVSVVNWSYP